MARKGLEISRLEEIRGLWTRGAGIDRRGGNHRYSVIGGATRVSQADAIHLASAAEAGVDVFFTNDSELRKLSIPGIRFFADLDGKVI